MSQQCLLTKQLSIYRANHKILDEAGITLQGGEVMALLGANGAGKSTLLSVLSGEREEVAVGDDAAIFLNGKNLYEFDAEELAKKRAVLPQSSALSFELSVIDILEMGLYPFPMLSAEQQNELLAKAISLADVIHLRNKSYLQLSGGEKQRVQFARVMVQLLAMRKLSDETLYFMLDEPTASLDPKYQQFLLQKLRTLCADDIGVLIILHDVNLAAFYCDRLLLLADKKILCCDEPKNALTEENLYQLYGVKGRAIEHPFCPDKYLVVWF
ncbi:MAG: ATP-binding cassette domain-containing protein [Alcaligenaceae bacterium]|jgi:iron complex transport system ATP-binding protein|nr:ATP-binding cassette domain-containing protein [Alcaligenaceae bacterium]